MLEIVLVISWFLIICGVANVLQKHWGYNYERYWWLHISLILVGIGGVCLYTFDFVSTYLFNSTGLLLGFGALVSFLLLELWRGKYIKPKSYYGHETLGGVYGGLLAPQFSGIVVKSTDVFFQDLVLLVTVVVLLNGGLVSILNISLLVALIVFLTHLPVIYFMGKVYGVLFTVLATGFSVITPFLIDMTPLAFYLIFAFHLLMYPVIMLSLWIYSRK